MKRRQVLALVGMGVVAGCTDDTSPADSTPTPSRTHDEKESFVVGSGEQAVEYVVRDVVTLEFIGSSAVTKTPAGIYAVVVLGMTNVGDESFDVRTDVFSLVDLEDRQFEMDIPAQSRLEQDPRIDASNLVFEQLHPGLSTSGAVAFDVVPGSRYRLQIEPVGMLSNADEHFVELGRLPAETPTPET